VVHSVPQTMVGVFEPFVLSNIIFFSCKCDLGGLALDQGAIVALVLQNKQNLVVWILEQYQQQMILKIWEEP